MHMLSTGLRPLLATHIGRLHANTAPIAMANDPIADGAPAEGSMQELLSFSLPILAACLAEPTLSTIDTLAIGRLSAAGANAGLAALNVNAAIFNMVSVMTSFLCTATTTVVGQGMAAAAQKEDVALNVSTTDIETDSPSSRALRDGLVLSGVLGCIIAAVLYLAEAAILGGGFGLARTGPIWGPASSYLRIRAAAVPAALATLVGVGVCLGRQDTNTPLRAVVLATLVNVFGDALLVWRLGWGLTGAAIATAAASYASAALICGSLVRELRPRWRRALRFQEIAPFLACSGALLVGRTLNAVTYTATSRVVAAAGSVAAAAAHQISLQCWWLFSFVSVPLSLAAQSLLSRRAIEKPLAGVATMRSVSQLAVGCGLLMALGNWLVPFMLPGIFTADATVRASLSSVALMAVASQFFISFATALDGVYIGTSSLGHYVMACTLGTASGWFAFRHGMRTGAGLSSAWLGLLLFSGVRALIHMLAYPALQRRIELAARAQQDAGSSAAQSEGGSAQLAATSAAGPGVEES